MMITMKDIQHFIGIHRGRPGTTRTNAGAIPADDVMLADDVLEAAGNPSSAAKRPSMASGTKVQRARHLKQEARRPERLAVIQPG